MKSLKKKFVITLTLILSMLIGSFAGVLLLNHKNKIYAVEEPEPLVTKVRLYNRGDDDNYYVLYKCYEKAYAPSSDEDLSLYFLYDDVTNRFEQYKNDSVITGNLYKFSHYAQKEIDLQLMQNENYNPFLKGLGLYKEGSVIYEIYSPIQERQDEDDIFMLKNANLETEFLEEVYDESIKHYRVEYRTEEFVLVQFQVSSDSATIMSLNVNIKLTNSKNEILNINPGDYTTISQTNSYSHLFNLKNNVEVLDIDSSTQIDEFEAQGKYEFTFTYNLRENGTVTTNNVKSTSCYILSENYYINPNYHGENNDTLPRDNVNSFSDFVYVEDDGHETEYSYNTMYNNNISNDNNVKTEPRLYNVERIDKLYYEEGSGSDNLKSEKDFFYFSNFNTVDYNGVETDLTESLHMQYPKITYDASKYNLNYVKTMYGITTFVTTALNTEISQLVVTYKNPANVWSENLPVIQDEDSYIATVEFREIGKYLLSLNFVLGENVFVKSETEKFEFEKESWNLIHSYELTIFGYQLMHSEYKSQTGATEKEMKYIDDVMTNSIFADSTNSNPDFNVNRITKIDLTVSLVDYPIHILNNNLAKTNQAPLFFRYYAQIDSDIDNNYYLYYKKVGNNFESAKDASNKALRHALTSNTRFTDNGLYVVCLNFTYRDYEKLGFYYGEAKLTNDGDMLRTQLFIFEIENIEPQVEFYSCESNNLEDKIKLATGGFTNKTVEINWQETLNNPFDVEPNIILKRNNFDEYKNDLSKAENINISNYDLSQGLTKVTSNGLYTVTIEYGPCTYAYSQIEKRYKYIYSASVVTVFTIDKENIGEGDNIVEFYEGDTSGQALSNRKISSLFTNKTFAIIYGTISKSTETEIVTTQTKRSGAKISVSYSFMPINSNVYNDVVSFDEDKIIPNGSEISSINNGIVYSSSMVNKTFKNLDSPSSEVLSVLNSDGVYIFTFKDEAGNSYIRYLTKDTTSPALIQEVNGVRMRIPSYSSSSDNMVNLDTKIIWGEYKAIKLNSYLPEEIIESLAQDDEENERYSIFGNNADKYLLVKIKDSNRINTSIPNNDEANVIKSGITIYYKDKTGEYLVNNNSNNIKSPISYTIKAEDASGKIIEDNEHLFKIRLFDDMGNYFTGKVEMTFDKSLLQAKVSGQPQNNVQIISDSSHLNSIGDGTEIRLYEDEVSNKKNLYLSWIQGSGDFEVVSVQCKFYPLTFKIKDANNNINKNYPYNPTYTDVFELTENTIIEKNSVQVINGVEEKTDRTRTELAIKAENDARFGDKATVPGMYEITRKYSKNELDENGKMSGERTYLFYIDRNNIISAENKIDNNNHYVGESISVVFGDQKDSYTFAGKDFLKQFVKDYIFGTNRQPGLLNVPRFKYAFSYLNAIDTEYISIEEYNLIMSDLKQTKIGINTLTFDIYDGDPKSGNSHLDINKGSENYFNNDYHIYKIVIEDNSQTSLEFHLAVNLNSPQANFIDNTNNSILTESQNNYISRNNTNVSLTWNVDSTGINSKIDENDITITQIFESGRKVILYSSKNNVNLSNTPKLIKESGNERFINFEDFSSVINKEIGNCRIEIGLKYLTDSAVFYGEYLSTTKIIYFDYEKPQYNFNILYDSDQYLAHLNIDKEEFEDYNSTVNFENYAFVVDSDYTLKSAPISPFWQKDIGAATTNTNDVESIWFRKYDKYRDDTGINQQSLVPGDPRYNKSEDAPTRLNFNPDLSIIKKDDDGNVIIDEYGNAEFTNAYTPIVGKIEEFNGFEKGCYYEIIEKDCANNYRVYTIYFLSDTEDEKIVYKETIQGMSETTYAELEISSGLYFEINNLKAEFIYEDRSNENIVIEKGFHNIGEWYVIDVLNGSNNLKLIDTLYVSPLNTGHFISLQDAVTMINNTIIDEEHIGKYFKINITTPKYNLININYRTPGQKYELDAKITTTSLIVTIDPTKYSGTYLKTLVIYEANEDGALSEVEIDSNNNPIIKQYSPKAETIRYVFTYSLQKVRNLWFKYTDNFGIEYQDNYILGITQTPFENMMVFDGTFIKNNNFQANNISVVDEVDEIELTPDDFAKFAEYYTASGVTFEYQRKIYSTSSIRIYKFDDENNVWKDLTTQDASLKPKENPNGINTIRLFEANSDDAIYLIVFKDTAEKYYQICVQHYTKVAELKFLDSNSKPHNFDISMSIDEGRELSISKVVNLSYEKFDTNSSYQIRTTVTAKLNYKNSDNVTITKDYGIIDSGFICNEYGKYIITATNELGSSKIYQFDLIKSDAIYYSVKAITSDSVILLSPSPVKYSYMGEEIDWYLSIYDMQVDVNQEKNLESKVVDTLASSNTTIYKISSVGNDSNTFQYERYVAVTKIDKNFNIIDKDHATITEIGQQFGENGTTTQIGNKKYIKSNAEKLILILPACYYQNGNLIKVRIIYENKDLGIVNEFDKNKFDNQRPVEIELKTAGQYKIYIYDLAGNQQAFGENNANEYLEISLINNFLYQLNGKKGLYNTIFNEKVAMFIEQRSNFVNDNNGKSYSITCTLNGDEYSPTFENGSYVFNSYGTYNVKLKGYLNKDINGGLINEVVTNVKFTILNPNEARLMHEYIGLNGYEVTKIIKNNTDITEDMKTILNTSSINKFAISGLTDGIGGSGVYQITVKAMLDKIIGETEFTYSVWINNDSDLLIVPSISEGDKTTKNITLQLNYYQIYSKIGECQLKVNGIVYADINSSSANSTAMVTLSSNSRFNITLETLSGNTITSLVVTKVEPLNSVAIIVIVVTSVVVAGLTITFILFRKRMRVR